MAVTFILRKAELQTRAEISLREALEMLGFSTETHIALRDGLVLAETDLLHEGDIIKLIPVISGGACHPIP